MDKAEQIVKLIENDISARRGIGDEWDQIDEDIKLETNNNW